MRKSIVTLFGAAVLAVTLTACGGTPPVEKAPVPTVEAPAAAPEVTEAPAAEAPASEAPVADSTGTREAPLHVGEVRKISFDSAWTVGPAGPTEVHDAYVVLPLTINIDWANFKIQSAAMGNGPDTPANPFWSVSTAFVAADGTSYDSMDDYSVEIPNEGIMLGDVYEPTASVTGNVAVSVPADKVAGGMWVVSNSMGDRVFIAQS